MSIANQITALTSDKTAIETAITNKGGTLSQNSGFDTFAADIATIPSAVTPQYTPYNDVNFIDYDGSVIYSYGKSDFLLLTELPQNPTHDGLTARGWNWNLSDAKDYVNNHGMLFIGQTYTTNDGTVKLHIEIINKEQSEIIINFTQTKQNGTTINWGDASTEVVGGTGNQRISHTYLSLGKYIITFIIDNDNSIELIENKIVENNNTALTEIHIGENIPVNLSSNYGLQYTSISAGTFTDLKSLNSLTLTNDANFAVYNYRNCGARIISLPNGKISLGELAFQNCTQLIAIAIPDTVTSIFRSFLGCSSLVAVALSNSLSTLGNDAFSGCSSLKSIIIPSSVTKINLQVFNNCTSLNTIVMKCETPPVLASTNALPPISQNFTIVVPAGSLNAYQNETNWAMFSDKMIEEASTQ